MNREEKLQAIRNRDKNYDGKFYCAFKTTKIVCHPSCSSKTPLERNIEFYNTLEEAINSGFRPCKICMKEFYKKNK